MLKLISRLLLWSTGWKCITDQPTIRKYVLIASPHTSNWDMVYMVAFAAVLNIRLRFLMKHTVFWWPLGILLRALGGMPVDRRSRQNLVVQLVAYMEQEDGLVLAVPAEGTRGYAEYWKSGFYHIAQGAELPIVPSFLDWGRKEVGFGPVIYPSGNIRADMDLIRAVYEGKTGRYPELSGPIRLREEDTEDELPEAAAAN